MSGGNESTTYLRGFKAAELKEEDMFKVLKKILIL